MLTLFCFLKKFRFLESWICAIRTHFRSLHACFPVDLWTQFRQTLQSVSIKHGLHNPHLESLVFLVLVPLCITAILFARPKNKYVKASAHVLGFYCSFCTRLDHDWTYFYTRIELFRQTKEKKKRRKREIRKFSRTYVFQVFQGFRNKSIL